MTRRNWDDEERRKAGWDRKINSKEWEEMAQKGFFLLAGLMCGFLLGLLM